MSKFVAVLVLSMGAVGTAQAGQLCFFNVCITWQDPPPPGTKPTAAPEIDPSSALSGLTLLAGGLAVLRGRRVRK